MYTILLSNNQTLENIKLNGNNFISESPVDSAIFEGGLSEVTVTNGNESCTYTDMVLLSNREEDGKGWFVLGAKSEQEKKQEAMLARMQELEEALRILTGGAV